MKIKCKSSKRFLLNINIEEYYSSIKEMGLDINIPIQIEIPCPRCKMVEVYEIYPKSYELIKAYKNNYEKDKKM